MEQLNVQTTIIFIKKILLKVIINSEKHFSLSAEENLQLEWMKNKLIRLQPANKWLFVDSLLFIYTLNFNSGKKVHNLTKFRLDYSVTTVLKTYKYEGTRSTKLTFIVMALRSERVCADRNDLRNWTIGGWQF